LEGYRLLEHFAILNKKLLKTQKTVVQIKYNFHSGVVTVIRLEKCGLILGIAGIYREIVKEEVGESVEDIDPNVKF
jgi:hypothetical protein